MRSLDRHKKFKDKCPICGIEKLRPKRHLGRKCRACTTSGIKKGRQLGPENPNWRGGRVVTAKGYTHIHMPNHPRSSKNGYIAEHILVAEYKIGRYLHSEEVVHHINRIKDDNRPENLRVMSQADHVHEHVGYKKLINCAKCGRNSDNLVFCSVQCRGYAWPNDKSMLLMSRTMSAQGIANALGGVSRQSVLRHLNKIK